MRIQTLLIFIFIPLFCTPVFVNGQDAPAGDIEAVFDGFAREMINRYPEYASALGLSEEMGYKVDHHRMADVSLKSRADYYKMQRRFRTQLKPFGRQSLTPSQQLDYDIMMYALDVNLAGEPYENHSYVINPSLGVHNSLTSLMTRDHPLDNPDNARAYISRLRAYRTRFQQLTETLKWQEKKGIIPHEAVIQRMKQSMARFIRNQPSKNLLYTTFTNGIKDIEMTGQTREELCREAVQTIDKVVYPAYRAFLLELDRILNTADQRAGVWKLPDGDAYYRYCLKIRTGSDLSPKAIHNLGLKEVKRIQRDMKRLMQADGFNPAGLRNHRIFGNVINGYWRFVNREKGRQLRYGYSEKGSQRALQDTSTYLAGILPKLEDQFEVLPRTKLIIAPVPQYKIDTMGAHYSRPSLDGKRKGVFYINLAVPPFKPGLQSLSLHEGVPGHHFQLSIESESVKLRMFRRFLFFTAYIEGWALYAEGLGRENGWFTSPESHIGSLNSELLRAARLVLDTGIHYKRWSREQALQYMADNLGWSSTGEIDRYMVWPAQACAYKLGELKILELRKAAKKKLKKNFDIKAFHHLILKHGSMPMPILEKLVPQ